MTLANEPYIGTGGKCHESFSSRFSCFVVIKEKLIRIFFFLVCLCDPTKGSFFAIVSVVSQVVDLVVGMKTNSLRFLGPVFQLLICPDILHEITFQFLSKLHAFY